MSQIVFYEAQGKLHIATVMEQKDSHLQVKGQGSSTQKIKSKDVLLQSNLNDTPAQLSAQVDELTSQVDLDFLCGVDNKRCKTDIDENGVKQLSLNDKGQVQFDGKAAGMSLAKFLEITQEGKDMSGPTGGIQGMKGTLFGIPYASGSWPDKLIEAFSGTHDMIGGKVSGLYDEQGNIKRGMTDAERSIYNNAVTTTAILPSLPFAAAELLSPEVWKAMSILLKGAK